MKNKKDITLDWLARYTGTDPKNMEIGFFLQIFRIMLKSLLKNLMLK